MGCSDDTVILILAVFVLVVIVISEILLGECSPTHTSRVCMRMDVCTESLRIVDVKIQIISLVGKLTDVITRDNFNR